MGAPYRQVGLKLSPINAERLRSFVAKHSQTRACELLGVGVVSIDRVLSGGAATPKTIARLVQALDRVAA